MSALARSGSTSPTTRKSSTTGRHTACSASAPTSGSGRKPGSQPGLKPLPLGRAIPGLARRCRATARFGHAVSRNEARDLPALGSPAGGATKSRGPTGGTGGQRHAHHEFARQSAEPLERSAHHRTDAGVRRAAVGDVRGRGGGTIGWGRFGEVREGYSAYVPTSPKLPNLPNLPNLP